MVRETAILLGLNQLTSWGILTTDAELTITTWNAWLEIHSGQKAEQVIGRRLFEVFPDLVTRRLDLFYHQALEGKVVVLAQRLHSYLLPLRPNLEGTQFTHMQQSVRLAPLVEDGRIAGTLTVIEDVTERVANDAELAHQALQQAAVATLGRRALAGEEPAALMDEVAALAAETLGVECSAVLEPLSDGSLVRLQAGVGWAEGHVGHTTVDAGPHSHAGYTLTVNEPIIIEDLPTETRFTPSPVLIAHGITSGVSVPIPGKVRPLGVVSVYTKQRRTFADDSIHFLQTLANVLGLAMERRSLVSELQTRLEQLAEADQRKDEFLAMLAHELRNPLAPLRNALQLLRMIIPNPHSDILEAQDIMERQIEHLVRLVDDLLDVSRITRGKIQLQTERVDLATVAARAIEGSRPLIDARRHSLDVSFPREPVFVHADPVRLAQVVWNLLNNAAKYTPEGGRITLTIERTLAQGRAGEEALVRVCDTGMGIPREMLAKVFDLFTQMERTLDRSEGGLGIGLTLVRRLIDMHGGTVQVFSEGTGMGSEFVLRLPIPATNSSAADVAAPPDSAAAGSQPAGRRILVVDDNRDSAESLAILLRLLGNDVRTTHDGRLALETAAAYRPDIVLLDIGLPGMDGMEVCRCMRQEVGLVHTMIVALTGYGQEEDRRRSHEAGFDAHLVKPVDLNNLHELLARPNLLNAGTDLRR